jgi:dolichol-phosphate mannosyltransferase
VNLKSLSIIIPTLDEQENITSLLTILHRSYHPLEIIVVDDLSKDKTALFVKKLQKKYKQIVFVENDPPLGLTGSLQKGVDMSKGEYIVWMDADFSHPPEKIREMKNAMKNADIVMATWYVKGGQDRRIEPFTRIYSYIVNFICQVLFGSCIHAYTSGYIMAKKSVFSHFRFAGNYGEYCIDFLVRQRLTGRKIAKVSFDIVSRRKGITKTNPNIKTFLSKAMGYMTLIFSLFISILFLRIKNKLIHKIVLSRTRFGISNITKILK